MGSAPNTEEKKKKEYYLGWVAHVHNLRTWEAKVEGLAKFHV